MKIKVLKVLHNQEFTKKDGSPYKAMVVTYDLEGETKTQRILGFAIKQEPSLRSLGDAVGQEVDVELGKGRFGGEEITAVNSDVEVKQTAGKTSSATSNSYQKPAFNEIGMRIMNSLNNAVVLVGQGASVSDVEKVARQILKLHDTLREPTKETTTTNSKKETTVVSKKVAVVNEDESEEDETKTADYDY